jgi:hypothetical protein
MYIRNEIKLATVPIYLVLLAFVVGGTAILARMAPALDEVLSENVASVEASAEMLAALAQGDGSSSYAQRDFHTAFEHARANITEEGEAELIGRIETHMDGAFAGDPAARSATVEALIQLERLNVASMRKASEGARSLGGAGMAAIVMFASIAIVVGLRSRRRLYRSIVNAVVELSATMRQATEAHDSLRRVSATQCATELALVADGVNRLLDERARRRGDEVGLSTIEKAALNRLLDRQSSPTMLVSRAGDLLAASSDVLAAIDPNRLAEVIDAARAAREARLTMPVFPSWVAGEAIGEIGWLLAARDDSALIRDAAGGIRHAVDREPGANSDPGVPPTDHDGGAERVAPLGATTVPEASAPTTSGARAQSIPHTLGVSGLHDDPHDDDHDEEHAGVIVRPGTPLLGQ